LIFFIFIVIDSSKIAYVREYADSILNKTHYSNTNLFIKFNNKIIYIKKIKPILKEAEDIKVFELKNAKVIKIITANKAVFKNNIWQAKNAKITNVSDKEITTFTQNIYFLKNFKPKIVSNLKQLNSISLYDAFIAIKIFKDVNTYTIVSIVLYKIFTPLSIIGLLIVFIFKVPVQQRISNVPLFLVKSVFLTVLIWGTELLIYKFSKQGVITPYVLILPFFVVCMYGFYLLYKEK